MRIDRLDLIAYGPFTEVSLDLSGGNQGLHIIQGANEAGKSTALRALRGWLFGFPSRLGDDYQHPYSSLRVGGVIRDEDGRTFEAIRRKAGKQTLKLADDKTDADEERLKAKLLGGMALDDFNLMLAIDSESLSAGGEAALKAGGKLAELIFGSGLDLATLRKFQKSLEDEIESLFKPAGQLPSINRTIKALDEKRKEIEDASMKGADWTDRVSAGARLRAELAETDREWRRVGLERERLRRITQARPDLARRETLNGELAKLAHAPRLADDFPARRRQAEADKITAMVQKAARAEDLARFEDAIAALPPPSAILQDADAVDGIQADLGGEKVASQNRAKRVRERAEYLKTAAGLLRDLGKDDSPETANSPRIKTGLKAQLASLSEQGNKLNADRDSTRRAETSARKRLEEAAKKLAEWPAAKDTDGLQRAMTRTRKIPDSPEGQDGAIRELEKIERQSRTLRAKLGDVSGSLDEIVNRPVPPVEILESYREEFQDAETSLNSARAIHDEAEDRLNELRKQIERRRLDTDVPDPSTLDSRRERRDIGWRLVKAEWLGPKSDSDTVRRFLEGEPIAGLPAVFEETIRSADDIADRLRHSANEVIARAHALAEQSCLAESLAILKKRRDECEAALEAIRVRWAAAWSGVAVSPRTPREMISWANLHATLAEKVEQIAEVRDKLASMDAEQTSAVADLHREFSVLGEDSIAGENLASARDRANAILMKSQAETAKRASAEGDRDKLERDVIAASERLADFDNQLATWRKLWTSAVEPLGLGPDVTPADAVAALEASSELSRSLDQANRIASEIRDAELASDQFRERLAALLTSHAPSAAPSPPEQAATALKLLLIAARADEEKRKTLMESRDEAARAIRAANESLERSRLVLESLASEAGIDGIEELAAIERLALDRAECERELRAVEGRLIAVAPGISPDDLEIEARTTSSEETELVHAILEEEFARLDNERQELNLRIGQTDQQILGMEATAKEARAEAAATEREDLMGVLEVDVERYVHLRLSLAVLKGAIEEYRNQNEAPVLRRASEHFARFTLGSFAGLRAELDDKDDPVLFGFRPDDARTLVGLGGMSDGTVDQLYLAMKLASIEHYFQARPPLPLILDDILVQFDDVRSVAALEALAELSKRMQVLFFTHHEHLVRIAEDRLSSDTLFVHRLGRRVMANGRI